MMTEIAHCSSPSPAHKLTSPAHQVHRRLSLRMVRPSLLDLRFTGDPWIVAANEGMFTICLGDYRLAGLSGLTIDLPSLNQVLDQLRHRQRRYPRL